MLQAFTFVCLFTLGCLAIGLALMVIIRKGIGGDLPTEQAVGHTLLILLLLGAFAVTNSAAVRALLMLAAWAYVGIILLLQRAQEKRLEEEIIDREVDKWGRAVAADPCNAGAYLFLGNALVQRSDYAGAAEQYHRSLELDPTNVRELLAFLSHQRPDVRAAVRERLPDLEQIERTICVTGTYTAAPEPLPAPTVPLVPLAPIEEPAVPLAPAAPVEPAPPRRELFGYDTEAEQHADQERQVHLSELRAHLELVPEDSFTRLLYARALEDSGDSARAREQYRLVLAREPDNGKPPRHSPASPPPLSADP